MRAVIGKVRADTAESKTLCMRGHSKHEKRARRSMFGVEAIETARSIFGVKSRKDIAAVSVLAGGRR